MQKLKIQPSLLEYSVSSLENKLDLVITKKTSFLKLSGQSKIYLHVDFVMKYFARERSVLASLGLETLWPVLESKFADWSISLSLHFMGLSDDLERVYKFFKQNKLPLNWRIVIYLPSNFASAWVKILESEQLKVGVWFDSDQLLNYSPQLGISDYLLLTVKAGKSGQSKTKTTNKLARQIIYKNKSLNFLVDGGWKPGSRGEKNCEMVSYSKFWGLLD